MHANSQASEHVSRDLIDSPKKRNSPFQNIRRSPGRKTRDWVLKLDSLALDIEDEAPENINLCAITAARGLSAYLRHLQK